MSTRTDVATQVDRVGDIQAAENSTVSQFLTDLQPELARALPKGMDAERITRVALTLVRQSELEFTKGNSKNSLANCSPESFAGALLTSSALGLEPGINGECYLVPYGNECTLIIGYQGLAKLFWQHPLAMQLDTHAVHERDQWSYGYGLNPFLNHIPADGDRGKITHYYAVGALSTGAKRFVVLSAEEVKVLRNGLEGPSGKIKDPQHWMERKTVLRQLFKLLPKSASLVMALEVDEQPGSVLTVHQVPQNVASGAIGALPASPVAAAAEQAQTARAGRVTASEVVGNDTGPRPPVEGETNIPPNCPVCGMPVTDHDEAMHAEAGMPVQS